MFHKIVLCLTWWMRIFNCCKEVMFQDPSQAFGGSFRIHKPTVWATHSYSTGYYFQPEFRFNGGDSRDAMEGRLEIRYNDQWGYVCADGFSLVEGDVVCKNMEGRLGGRIDNHRLPALEVYPISNFSRDAAPIILEGVNCNGSEDRLYECQHNGLFNASCPSSAVVGLKCGRRQSDYVRDMQREDLQKTYIGLEDPNRYHYHENNLNTIERLPYWWGYFCDNRRGYQKGELHCRGIDIDADKRFALENNVFYSVGEPECTLQEASEIQCGTYDECSEFKNDSTICIVDEKALSLGIGVGYWADGEARLRLVGGNSSLEGRLEISWGGGIWGSVCSRFWGVGSARFACRHLGFSGIEDYGTVEGNASYPMLQYLSCNNEDETYWSDCLYRYTRPEKIVCDSYATVKCSAFANEGTLRLTGAAPAREGRVEIFRDGVWGGVSIRNRNVHTVVCNQLGYPGRYRTFDKIEFEVSTNSPVLLDIIYCEGSEASLLDCVHRWYNHSDKYSKGANTRCNRPGNFTPRLYNGTSVYEGRLEIWEGNQWRRVCNSTIGRRGAEVICRQLGHKSLETFYNWSEFGNGINPVLSWSFSCNHMVPFLNQCDYSYVTTRNLDCDSVAVKCIRNEKDAAAERMFLGAGSSSVKLILAVFFSLVGVATVLGLVFFTVKRERMCKSGPTDEIRGPQMPPDYRSLQATTPRVNILTDATPPPSYTSLFPEGHPEPGATVEPDGCNQILNTSV